MGRPAAGHASVFMQAGYRGQISLCQLQYLPQSIRLRLSGQSISAANTVGTFHKPGAF